MFQSLFLIKCVTKCDISEIYKILLLIFLKNLQFINTEFLKPIHLKFEFFIFETSKCCNEIFVFIRVNILLLPAILCDSFCDIGIMFKTYAINNFELGNLAFHESKNICADLGGKHFLAPDENFEKRG